MNLRALLAFGSLLLVGTGCPHDWVKGGANDRAMAKDTREMLDDDDDLDCPEGMTLKKNCKELLPDGNCRVECQ